MNIYNNIQAFIFANPFKLLQPFNLK